MSTILESLQSGLQHHQAGELRRAEQMYQEVLGVEPDHPDALHLLGVIAHQGGKHQQAVERIGRAIASNPRVAAYHNNLGSVYDALGKVDQAVSSYRRALEIAPNLADAHNNLGSALRSQWRLDEAVASLRRAIEINPGYTDAHNNLGVALRDQGDLDEATRSLRRALELRNDYAEAHNNLGNALKDQGKLDEAVSAYKRALEVKPGFADALGNLASAYERLNRLDEAAAAAAEGRRAAPDHPQVNLVLAKLEGRQGRFRQAIDRVEKLRQAVWPDSDIAREATYLLGHLYDGAGDASRAFEYFTEANQLATRRAGDYVGLKRCYHQSLDALARLFSQRQLASWSPAPPLGNEPAPVFLIGFARSGTTLLDAILDSHPRIQTLEEKPTVHAMHKVVEALPGGFAQALGRLAPEQFEQLRDTYFRTVDAYIERRPGQILIDRNPMNTPVAGFMLRVFPAARFIVAARHPCDVCLSCFMQDFKLNDATANFYTLQDTAALYVKVMDLWRRYVDLLPHPYHVVRYEDLVDDFEGQTRRMLEFLGLDWDDAVRRYAEGAKSRGMISTPSYGQVTEPIHRRARYRWRRYAEQLAPVMSLLRPHIESFGYDVPEIGDESISSYHG